MQDCQTTERLLRGQDPDELWLLTPNLEWGKRYFHHFKCSHPWCFVPPALRGYLGNMRRWKYLKWNLPPGFVIYELCERIEWNMVKDPGSQDTSKVGLSLWRQSNLSKTPMFHLSQCHPNPWNKYQIYLFHPTMKLLIKLLVPHLGLGKKNHMTAMSEHVLIVYFSVCNASESQVLAMKL